MSLVHLFENRTLTTAPHPFNSVNQYTVQLSSTQDDHLYDLYNSYFTFKVRVKLATSTSSSVIIAQAAQQPAGIVKNSTVNYQYINENNEVMNVVLQDESQYIGQARNVLTQLFTTKNGHDQAVGLTEFAYNSSGSNIFNGSITLKQHTNTEYDCDLNVPLSQVLAGCNSPSFINLKMLKADLTFVEPDEFFKMDTSSPTKLDTNIGAIEIKKDECSIVRCDMTLHTYSGDVSSVTPDLRILKNTQLKHDIIKMKNGDQEYVNQITVPFKSSYLIMYMTDDKGNHNTLSTDLKIKQWRVGLTGVADSYKTTFMDSTEKDPYWYFILNYCANVGRDDATLINYTSWHDAYHYFCLPLNEMLPQQANNLFNFSLKLQTAIAAANGRLLHLIWVKSGADE